MGVLCAPKFGALMRDTLRPDALPASPRGGALAAARTLARPREPCASPRASCAVPRTSPTLAGFSLCLADSLASYAAFVFRAVPRFRLFNASQCSTFRSACLAPAALRCICFFSPAPLAAALLLVARHYSRIGALVLDSFAR